jgi:hypothetical protein
MYKSFMVAVVFSFVDEEEDCVVKVSLCRIFRCLDNCSSHVHRYDGQLVLPLFRA